MTAPVKTDAAAPLRVDEIVVKPAEPSESPVTRKPPRTSEEFTRDLRDAVCRLMTDPNDHEAVEVLVKICLLNCKLKSGPRKGKKIVHLRRAVGLAPMPKPLTDGEEDAEDVEEDVRFILTDDPLLR